MSKMLSNLNCPKHCLCSHYWIKIPRKSWFEISSSKTNLNHICSNF